MSDFKIVTDSTTDLPLDYIKENNLEVLSFHYHMNGIAYGEDKELESKEFYRLMREEGMLPTTSQINPEQYMECFRKVLEETKNILCIVFSSALSGSFNSARIAAEDMTEECPEAKIIVIDSKCASLGEGLFVHKALQKQKSGASMEETAAYLEEIKLNVVHNFTVDDLNHLYRGGRVSKTAAFLGTLAGIKPMLHVDDEGRLIPLKKIHGRKKSLLALVSDMEEKVKDYDGENDIVFISHGDAVEDAEYVKAEIQKRLGIENVVLNCISPTIGAHAGPGTIALFFMGTHR